MADAPLPYCICWVESPASYDTKSSAIQAAKMAMEKRLQQFGASSLHSYLICKVLSRIDPTPKNETQCNWEVTQPIDGE